MLGCGSNMERVLEPEVMDTADEAAEYDAMDHSAVNEAFVHRLFALGAAGHMLDIGTGPGHIPVLVCQRDPAARVIGVDLSRHMLHVAERRRREAGVDRIEYKLADAKELPFADGHFDTVFSNTILHHIPDPAPFIAEAHRVLRSGGTLLIRDLFRPDDQAQVDALVARYAADCTAQQRQLFRASLCAALTPDELRRLVFELGIVAEVTVDSDRHMSLQVRRRQPAPNV
jgi:ubiquinone/menaquinone biosynthesis C-methylase UbiE